MKKYLLLVPVLGLFSGCNLIQETQDALETNRQAVDASTCAIQRNIEAIENANRGIEENRAQLQKTNEILRKAAEQ